MVRKLEKSGGRFVGWFEGWFRFRSSSSGSDEFREVGAVHSWAGATSVQVARKGWFCGVVPSLGAAPDEAESVATADFVPSFRAIATFDRSVVSWSAGF